MVLVDEKSKPIASWEFDADIAILTHSTTIQPRYQVKRFNSDAHKMHFWIIARSFPAYF